MIPIASRFLAVALRPAWLPFPIGICTVPLRQFHEMISTLPPNYSPNSLCHSNPRILLSRNEQPASRRRNPMCLYQVGKMLLASALYSAAGTRENNRLRCLLRVLSTSSLYRGPCGAQATDPNAAIHYRSVLKGCRNTTGSRFKIGLLSGLLCCDNAPTIQRAAF